MTGAERERPQRALAASPHDLDPLLERIGDLLYAAAKRGEDRAVLLGLAGPPGAGKSSLTSTLAAQLSADGVRVSVVPMDGFHLSRRATAALGRMHRRGAPDTFDADGYVALLRRLTDLRARGRTVWAPDFQREFHDPVAGDLPVDPAVDVVLTEGNYLLLDEEPWDAIPGLLDEIWYLEPDDDTARRTRLVARHVTHGREPEEAERHVAESDEVNARRIAATAERAAVRVAWGTVR